MHPAKSIRTSIFVASCIFAAGPALAQSVDWTGAYAGVELGGANFDASTGGVSLDNDGLIGGLIAGYDYDFGTWVIGGGVDVDFSDISIAGASLDSIWRLKARGGYKIGNGLLYATGGYANADISTVGDDDGYFIGAGYEYLTQSNFSIGGEVLFHEFDNFNGTGINVEVVTYQIRGTFRF